LVQSLLCGRRSITSSQGLTVLIKLDGERQSDEFTVVITGAALGDGPWARRDAADIETALVGALADFMRPG
jgi:hypothetical protein